MVQINFALKEVSCKIVYYGPGMSGKTTNLEIVHLKAPEANKGDLTSIATEGDRTLFFDFMPLDLGNIAGMRTKFQLYTVPGQVYYNSTRKLVLQGVDGIVFVADSQASMREENIESFENLKQNLAEYGKDMKDISVILQYNKRDLPNAMSTEDLDAALNPDGEYTTYEAIATTGEGVFPTLKSLAGLVLESLNRDRRQTGAPGGVPSTSAVPNTGSTRPATPDSTPAPAQPTPTFDAAPVTSSPRPQRSNTVVADKPAARSATETPAARARTQSAAQQRSARPTKQRRRPAPKIQKVVLEEDRGSMLMMGLLVLIILAAAGVILISFNVV